MKDNLENSIKESLQDFEMSYNPKAWEALSSKLDAANPASSLESEMKQSLDQVEMPYNPKAWDALRAKLDVIRPVAGPTSNFKWYAIAATTIVATVSAFFYFTHDNNTEISENLINNDTIQTIEEKLNNTVNGGENKSSTNTEINTVPASSETLTTNGNTTSELVAVTQNQTSSTTGSTTNSTNSVTTDQTATNQTGTTKPGSDKGDGTNSTNNDGTLKINFVSPTVNMLCLNESVELNNKNELKLWVIAPSGGSFLVNPMQSNTFKPEETGIHKLGYYNAEGFVETGAFNVKSLPFVDFYVDKDQKYENGVPVTKVETNVPGSNFSWNMGNTTVSGREAAGHFFKKGYYDITLNVTGANGCTNSKTEKVYIEHEYGDRGSYNLLAPSGLHLNSTDEKNRTFMPDGLKLREVKFRMVIYSIQDGHVVYETQDSTKPWNGVDQSTGRQVGHGTSYHWEVTIENPMKGESPSYKGGLTVLIN